MNCDLCNTAGGEVLARDAHLRVVLIDEPDIPGFVRVIWNAHVKEMSDLSPDERAHLMAAVFAVEPAMRRAMSPDKVNLASLGNMTPHLHWHVIPRFVDDRYFPGPIWSTAQREADADALEARRARLPALRDAVRRILEPAPGA